MDNYASWSHIPAITSFSSFPYPFITLSSHSSLEFHPSLLASAPPRSSSLSNKYWGLNSLLSPRRTRSPIALKWKGPHWVILTSLTAAKPTGFLHWIPLSHLKQFLPHTQHNLLTATELCPPKFEKTPNLVVNSL